VAKNTTMKKLEWFERQFSFGVPAGMLPFYLERLQGTTARLYKKVEGVSEEILSNKLDGKWSVKQNIGHLAEVDEIANKRIDEMVQGITPMSPAVFEPKLDYNSKPIKEVIALFANNRKENLKKYKQLNDETLAKSSIHPRLKVQMTPVDLAYFDAEHDDHHLVRINEILTALNSI
jgi:hypothetical protein